MLLIKTAANPIVVEDGGYDIISVDSRQGGFIAGRHLRSISQGPACFVGVIDHRTGDLDATSSERLEGFKLGWEDDINNDHIVPCRYYTMESAAETVPQIMNLTPRPHAIFCASDEIAVGITMGALGAGLKAGRDYMLVGFDGQERAMQMGGGPVTTIAAPWREITETAVELLTQRFRNPHRLVRHVQIGCRLQQGATTEPPATDNA
jgi:LacI family transcriptional regulator